METVSLELFQRIRNVFTGKEIEGNSVVLTVDDRLQQLAAKELGNSRGAIVAMEPDTGRILAMVSNPTFDSNTVSENWSTLNSDEDNSPLLNRAAQGLYPPGSVFKIITAAAAIEAGSEAESFSMRCLGEMAVGHSVLHCYNGNAHGNVDMTKAFAKSCNTYFASVAAKIGAPALISEAESFGFNSDINFPLEYNSSLFSLTKDCNANELAETAIGQGKTLVTPLFMAMVTSAIANNGTMMQPYIVDHIKTPWGGTTDRTIPVKLRQVCDASTAYKVKELMCEVVNSGTGQDAAFSVSGTSRDKTASGSSLENTYSGTITVAGKTGTAENSSGDDHAWFVAFAPAEKPRIAVAVLLENAGHGSKAIPDARELMKLYLENLNN
jgi:peptidoglycan glycosyltransferase